VKIVRAKEMERIDRRTIRDYRIPGRVLMERAGLAVTRRIVEDTSPETTAVVVCGKGNNGGDGLVVARELRRAGRPVVVMLLADPGDLSGETAENLTAAERFGVPVRVCTRRFALPKARPAVVVDAMLGTGLSSPLRGIFLRAAEGINRSGLAVYAVDIPTGISSDTGAILGTAVKARCTVTFGLPKRGHILYPGAGYTGRLHIADIGFPSALLEDPAIAVATTEESDVARALPPRPPDAHKGSCGRVLLVAGSRRMTGAAIISALAAFRSGAGLVTVASTRSALKAFPSDLMEAITIPLPESPGGAIDPAGIDAVIQAARNASAVAVGPGLSREPEIDDLVEALIARVTAPLVIDADGINALEGKIGLLAERKRKNLVLTPHPAEMGRLMGKTTVQVQSDRMGMVEDFFRRTGQTVVLKGPNSLVGDPAGRMYVNTTGNDGLATAGSGDVLTGILVTLLAQKMRPVAAARTAVWIHGRAADHAVSETPKRSLMARDVLEVLPSVFKELERPVSTDSRST